MTVEPTDATGGPVSVFDRFEQIAQLHCHRPAVEDELGCAWTYGELLDASLRVSSGLWTRIRDAVGDGQRPAPTVALLMRRTCAWVAACLGAARLGLPVLALSGDLQSAEERQRNREAMAEHRPVLLVLDEALKEGSAAAAALEACKELVVVEASMLAAADGHLAEAPGWPRHADNPLYVVYTGGTTSASKSVVVTHRMALHELDVYPQIAPLSDADRVLHQTSAYWGATSLGIFDIAWAVGACLVLAEGAGPADVTRAIETKGVTVAGLVPSVLEAIDEDRCRSLRTILTWGEALAPATIARWSKHVALLDLLIATEYWLILYADYRVAPGAGGRGFLPVPGAGLTLRAPDRDGAELQEEGVPAAQVANGEVGELFMSGPMVSSVGYTDPARNRGAFVDLPTGPGGRLVRHFRTRDLARRGPDGSLEYCGRADGFAKVGGKWLDLTSVERKLLAGGCKDAVLVWDECNKRRHAAVVLESSQPPTKSMASRIADLQQLLPGETKLHVLKGLPHHPTTGKVHRGALVKQLVEASARPAATPVCRTSRVRASLVCGLLLAARTGARGAALLPLACQLAPGLLAPGGAAGGLLADLAEGLAWNTRSWVSSLRACRCLSPKQHAALPYIMLLLLDAPATGLQPFQGLVREPLGLLGVAIIVCRSGTTWLPALLAMAGAVHARRARGGNGWLWAFWTGFSTVASQWVSERWEASQSSRSSALDDAMVCAVGALRRAMGSCKGGSRMVLPELRRCGQCWEWAQRGDEWRGQFYCDVCTEGWNSCKKSRTDEPSSGHANTATPVQSPRQHSTFHRPSWCPPIDELNFSDHEVKIARSHIPACHVARTASGGDVARSSKAVTAVSRVIERCTGVDAGDPAASLSGLESLKVITLVSALRREAGIELAAGDVLRCSTVRDLECLCAEARPTGQTATMEVREAPKDGWAVFAIPRFWKAPVGWLIRLHEFPDEAAMRAACQALVHRHPGLRAAPYGSGDEAVANICNSAAPMVPALRAFLGAAAGGARGLCAQAARGLLAAWPRIASLPDSGPEACAHFEWLRFETQAELQQAAWLRARSRGFRPPATISMLVLVGGAPGEGAEARDTAYLQVAVNHAVTDAASIVPLVTDLIELHRAALAAGERDTPVESRAAAALAAANLPPVLDGLQLQHERLHAALLEHGASALDVAHSAFLPRRRGYDHYVRLMPGACRLLSTGSSVVGVSPDHLLVTALAVAFGETAQQSEVKLSLIVPMRDDRGENQVVANLASTRHLSVWAAPGRPLLEVALELSGRLRRRDWQLCDILGDDGDRLLINVRGIPAFAGATPVMESVDTSRKPTRFVRNVVEMFADQESEESWTLWIGMRDDFDGAAFARALRRALWGFATNPLEALTHSGAA